MSRNRPSDKKPGGPSRPPNNSLQFPRTLTDLLRSPDPLTDDNDFDSDLTNDNLLLTNQQLLLTNQQRLLQNQLRIMQQMGRLEKLMTSAINNTIVNQRDIVEIQPKPARRVPQRSQSPAFERIDSLEQLQQLENQLKDSNYREQLVKKMSSICGVDGKQNGINCSYILVDHFFTRRFMTQCSWAGGSRNTDGGKVPFKVFLNLMNLFHTLVQKADKDFSMIHCQQFFKKVIKNSTRRNTCGPITRASRTKCRPKKIVYQKMGKSDVEQTMHKELFNIKSFDTEADEGEPSTNMSEMSVSDESSIEQRVDNDYYADDTTVFVKNEVDPLPQGFLSED